jgi:hypothetical protein
MSGSAMENHNKLETDLVCAGFEVFIDVVMNSYIVWVITPRSLLKVNLRLGGTYELHLALRGVISRKVSFENVLYLVRIRTWNLLNMKQ